MKRLWKHRVTYAEDETSSPIQSADDLELKSVAQSMLKRLKETQLCLLVQAVESRGGDTTSCVLVPKGDVRVGRRTVAPHVLCCQLWRWPDVRHPFELKRLTCCSSVDDPVDICCNPYHWSRLCKSESPPPPYSRCALERFKPEDRAPSEPVSMATGCTNQYGSFSSHQGVGDPTFKAYWCKLAYWEMRTRVGRLFPVYKQSVNVFDDLLHGEGMCLGTLSKQHQTSNDAIRRTREKIGFGLCLSKEADGVWVYNRSEHAIFVNSPTLHPPSARSFVVYKVPPGHSIKIFDFDKSLYYQQLQDNQLLDGPFDPNSVRISFAKGWGPKYSRQVITSCPCWLEVLLVPR